MVLQGSCLQKEVAVISHGKNVSLKVMAGKPTETVLDIINKRMIPNEQAKKARGEVFTPISLVC